MFGEYSFINESAFEGYFMEKKNISFSQTLIYKFLLRKYFTLNARFQTSW